jgi:hypothetical protein
MEKAVVVTIGVVFNETPKKFLFKYDSINESNFDALIDQMKKEFDIEEAVSVLLWSTLLNDYFEVNAVEDFPIEKFAKFKLTIKSLTIPQSIASDSGNSSLGSLNSVAINESVVTEVPSQSVLILQIWRPNRFECPMSKFSDECRTELILAKETYDAHKLANPKEDPPHHTTSKALDKEIRSMTSNYLFDFMSYPTKKHMHDAVSTLIRMYPFLAIRGGNDQQGVEGWINTIVNKLRELRRDSDRADVLANKRKCA